MAILGQPEERGGEDLGAPAEVEEPAAEWGGEWEGAWETTVRFDSEEEDEDGTDGEAGEGEAGEETDGDAAQAASEAEDATAGFEVTTDSGEVLVVEIGPDGTLTTRPKQPPAAEQELSPEAAAPPPSPL